jgi:hypothetical protein
MCEGKRVLKERLVSIVKIKKHIKITVLIAELLLIAAVLTACASGMGGALMPDGDDDGGNTDNSDWRTAAEEFLYARPSIFGTDRAGNNNPNAFVTYDDVPGDGIYHGGYVYYDREGNAIEEAPFLIGEAPKQAVAWGYDLIDLDGTGIPAISVVYALPESGGGFPHYLYLYRQGAYSLHDRFGDPQFFRNQDGNIIIFEWANYMDDLRVLRLTPLGDEGYRQDTLADWNEFSLVDVEDKNPALFELLGQPLTEIEPSQLHESLTEAVMQKLNQN